MAQLLAESDPLDAAARAPVSGEPLSVEEVRVSYGSTPVLKGVSLEVAPGEFIALLGSSGCGKTTLLRAISGFVQVEAGHIRIAGRDITALPPEKRGMAMVFQSYALWPHMTAAQNIAYGLRLRGITRSDRAARVEAVLALLGLEGLGQRRVTALSGGQRQRVALGRALAVNPRILLLDEPLSNLDARIRQSVRHEIKELQGKLGITAIHVTHDREEAMVMADRIAIMDAGRIVQLGPPEEVYNRPASPFVAAFMGADNVIEVDAAPNGTTLRIAAGPHNDAAELPVADGAGRDGVHLAEPPDAPAPGGWVAHFRSEAAELVAPVSGIAGNLVLRGQVHQSAYIGGTYRYGVDVGKRRFLVDDARAWAVGEAIGVVLPAKALHLFPAAAAS